MTATMHHGRFDPVGPQPARASILIRTKDEAKELASTLVGVFDQTLMPHEVVVIDSGSTDGTVEIARQFPVILMEMAPEDWSYSGALNMAARRATGDVLVCLSAHCRPTSDRWLESLCRHFDDPDVAGVWGPGLRPGRDAFAPGPPLVQHPGTYGVDNRFWGLSNADSAVRRSRWAEEPFDEDMPATEDKAWGQAMLDRGFTIVHEPAAAVWHPPHTVGNEFHRNLAVQAGFRKMFPELDEPYGGQVRIVTRQLRQNLRTRLRRGDVRGLWHDASRLPGVLSALAGGMLGIGPGAGLGRWRTRVRRTALARPSTGPMTGASVAGLDVLDLTEPLDLRERRPSMAGADQGGPHTTATVPG